MVIPRQPLENIIRAIISSPDDYDDLVHHIGTAQKIRAEWTSYRQKMPDDLLAKFKRLLDACRENGYIAPRVEDGKMVFSQILSRRRNCKQTDQCTLCSNKLIDQSCNGKLKEVNHQRMFVKCWEL